MTLFIEPYRKPHEHMMVVQSLLLLESHRGEQIYFISSEKYYNSIPEHCKNNVEFIKLTKFRSSSLLLIFNIFYLVFKYNLKLKPNRIILLSTKSYSSFLIKIWTLFSLSSNAIYVLLHGELQYLINNETLSKKADSFFNKLNLRLNNFFNSNFKFVILSNLVYKNLCNELGFTIKNVIHLDLPYDYTSFNNSSILNQSNDKLILSTIGVNAVNKNSHLLNILADRLGNEIDKSFIELRCIGRVHDVVFRDSVKLLNLEGSYFVDPFLYSKLILESSFILSFVDDQNYSLISSGSYFDCIKYQKPILALKNSQWEYNFQNFGEIGILFNSINEMVDYILSLLDKHEDRFQFNSKLNQAINLTGIKNNVENYIGLFV